MILGLIPLNTQALEVDVYGGFGAGLAAQKQNGSDDTSDSGEKAYFGSRFLGPLGIEAAYYNLGKYNNGVTEVTAIGLDAVANLDIRGMTFYAKGGLIEWTETDLVTNSEVTGKDVTYGIGLNLPVDRHVLVRTELEQFRKIGKDDASGNPGKDMVLMSFGINFKF